MITYLVLYYVNKGLKRAKKWFLFERVYRLDRETEQVNKHTSWHLPNAKLLLITMPLLYRQPVLLVGIS